MAGMADAAYILYDLVREAGHPDSDHCFIAELYYLFPVYQEFQQDFAKRGTPETAVSERRPS